MVERQTLEEFIGQVTQDWEWLGRIDDGYEWSIPPQNETYRIDHRAKILVWVSGPLTPLHAAYCWAAGRMGYDVLTEAQVLKLKKEYPELWTMS